MTSRRRRLELDARTAEAGLGTEQRIEIDGENVGLDDFDVRGHAEAQAKLRGQHAVEFDGDQAARALGQRREVRTPRPGADFEHRILRYVARASTICKA
jgi:hypothetical protein